MFIDPVSMLNRKLLVGAAYSPGIISLLKELGTSLEREFYKHYAPDGAKPRGSAKASSQV